MTIKAINVRNQFKGTVKEILEARCCRKSTYRLHRVSSPR